MVVLQFGKLRKFAHSFIFDTYGEPVTGVVVANLKNYILRLKNTHIKNRSEFFIGVKMEGMCEI